MGEVWRAFDTATERVVAIKVLSTNLANDEAFSERFRREARIAASLEEPHVVPIYDFGEVDSRLFVAMRLVKGRDLESMLAAGPLPPSRAVNIVEQVALALHAAHETGLVHRDVKPSNVLVARNDFVYLIDFGLARATGDAGLTSSGMIIGTWAYMSPERLNTGQTDQRADVYALACVLHEALTGRRPFPGDSLEQQVVGHLTAPPPRPSTMQPDVPAEMDDVIATGMAKNPDRRYRNAIDLAAAARAALSVRRGDSAKVPRFPTTPSSLDFDHRRFPQSPSNPTLIAPTVESVAPAPLVSPVASASAVDSRTETGDVSSKAQSMAEAATDGDANDVVVDEVESELVAAVEAPAPAAPAESDGEVPAPESDASSNSIEHEGIPEAVEPQIISLRPDGPDVSAEGAGTGPEEGAGAIEPEPEASGGPAEPKAEVVEDDADDVDDGEMAGPKPASRRLSRMRTAVIASAVVLIGIVTAVAFLTQRSRDDGTDTAPSTSAPTTTAATAPPATTVASQPSRAPSTPSGIPTPSPAPIPPPVQETPVPQATIAPSTLPPEPAPPPEPVVPTPQLTTAPPEPTTVPVDTAPPTTRKPTIRTKTTPVPTTGVTQDPRNPNMYCKVIAERGTENCSTEWGP